MAKRLIKNRTIDVILLESDKNLGEKYEVISVKPIFAKNVLLPKWIAVVATADNLHKYELKMQKTKEKLANKVKSLNELFMTIQKDWWIVVTKKMNEKGTLYDKVGSDDVLNLVEEKYSIKLDAYCIKMKKKISAIGEFKVSYKYKDLDRNILLIVKWEEVKTTKEEKGNKEEKKGNNEEQVENIEERSEEKSE